VNVPSKVFLALAVAGLGVGTYVTLTSAKLHPDWTLALPLGVISLGMFFLTYFLQGPAARYDEEQNRKLHSPERTPQEVPGTGGQRAQQASSKDGLKAGQPAGR
jgi:hypothetical protein